MSNFHSGWYLIYTRPRHEKKVHTRLAELNIDSFLPTKKTLRTWHDRRKYIDEPLFPSYIFVCPKDQQEFYSGMDIDGAMHYVRSGRDIARVSEKIIEDIRLIVDRGKDIEISGNYFKAGQQLEIRQGPLTGLSCEMVEFNGKRKFLVRVSLLQRNILISLPSEYLVPARPAEDFV